MNSRADIGGCDLERGAACTDDATGSIRLARRSLVGARAGRRGQPPVERREEGAESSESAESEGMQQQHRPPSSEGNWTVLERTQYILARKISSSGDSFFILLIVEVSKLGKLSE